MQVIALQNVPNQSFVTTQDNNRYEIRIYECNGCMVADVTFNGSVLFTGLKCSLSLPLIPYAYMQGQNGNFFFVNNNQVPNEPWWYYFTTTQMLVYASFEEITAPS